MLTIVIIFHFIGVGSLNLEESSLDPKLIPMSKASKDLLFYYDTVHDLTCGL